MKRTPIRKISSKRAKEVRIYLKLAAEFLQENPVCHVCAIRHSNEVHHTKGRQGSMLNNRAFWISVCRFCHTRIENNRAWAMSQGYLVDRLGHE